MISTHGKAASNDRSMMLKIHGNYEIDITGELLILRFKDAWNTECSMDFFKQYKKIIRDHKFNKFGIVLDYTNFEGATPEAINYFHKISKWADENGAAARAFIIDTELTRFSLREHILDNGFIPRMIFKDEKSAVSWLIEKGIQCPS